MMENDEKTVIENDEIVVAVVDGNAMEEFKKLRGDYLYIYLSAVSADWIKGPYIYSVYQSSYNLSISEIAFLFIIGYISSSLVGTISGSLADIYGRRLFAIVYGITYALSCLCIFFDNFFILCIGRILGGLSTSLLFTVFEAWLVSEHKRKGFSDSQLQQVFSYAVLGNGILAILAGLVANICASIWGDTAPFLIAIVILIHTSYMTNILWTENVGDGETSVYFGLKDSLCLIFNDFNVLCLGITQSMYEAAMYVFVFMWTPVFEELQAMILRLQQIRRLDIEKNTSRYYNNDNNFGEDENFFPLNLFKYDESQILPLGLIFAIFMVAVSTGGGLYMPLMKFVGKIPFVTNNGIQSEAILLITIFGSFLSLFIVAVNLNDNRPSIHIILIAFTAFEFFVGIFYPAVAMLRSLYIAESNRATIMNIFRLPLNIIVVVILSHVGTSSKSRVFMFCALGLLSVFIVQLFSTFRIYQRKRNLKLHGDMKSNL